jgi:hypothetical protein
VARHGIRRHAELGDQFFSCGLAMSLQITHDLQASQIREGCGCLEDAGMQGSLRIGVGRIADF